MAQYWQRTLRRHPDDSRTLECHHHVDGLTLTSICAHLRHHAVTRLRDSTIDYMIYTKFYQAADPRICFAL
jgi:hypothetical protein